MAAKTIQDFVIGENSRVAPVAVEQPPMVVPIKIAVTLNVPATFMADIEANTALIREYTENLAFGLGGLVASVDIA